MQRTVCTESRFLERSLNQSFILTRNITSEAADKGVKGTVKLRVFVAQDGAVKKTLVVCGNPLLVPAAQAALQRWTYRPVLLNDQPVEFVINEIKLSFPPVPSRQQ